MSLISRSRKQRAVYWDVAGFDDGGQAIFAEPVKIKCRWEDIQEVFPDQEGKEKRSNAKVYVDRDVKVQGVLWLWQGNPTEFDQTELEDILVEPDKPLDLDEPFNNPDAYAIQKRNKIPNMKATEFLRECWL